MKNLSWIWLHDKSYQIKNHMAPASLVPHVLSDVQARASSTPDFEKRKEEKLHADFGGALMIDRADFRLNLRGLQLVIPMSHVSMALERFRATPLRTGPGKVFFKHHFWHSCLVLPPALNDVFLAALEAALPEALAVESLENEEFNRRIVDRHPNVQADLRPIPVQIIKA